MLDPQANAGCFSQELVMALLVQRSKASNVYTPKVSTKVVI